MADRGDTHYHVRKLNLWFAVSSFVLLGAAFWMVIDDWNRPWKHYQREFRELEIKRANDRLAEASAQEALAEEARLQERMAEAEASLAARQTEIDQERELLLELKGTQFTATEAEKKAKQTYNYERWAIEEHRLHENDPTYGIEKLNALEETLSTRLGEKQVADAAVEAQVAKLKQLDSAVKEIEVAMKAATKEIDLVRLKLASIDPKDAPTKIANIVRDFPGLDFIGPSLKVNKVLPANLTFDLNFTTKPRIDMCQTCHLAADKADYDGEHPFKSHPNLDLFLTAKSPHPLSEFGCSICHRGSGESLDFQRADHRANTEEEGRLWHDEYHWHKQHYWDYPMLATKNIEASCVQCHKDSMEIIAPDAPKVAEGFQLFEQYGCYACHKVDWFPTKRRPGPSLVKLAQKTDKNFVDSWIADPKGFRPTTRMPQIFHLENYSADTEIAISQYGKLDENGEPVGRRMMGDEWSDAAVASVSAFILSRTSDEPVEPIPVEGDADRGYEVFRLSGCLACHNMAPHGEEMPAEWPEDEEYRGPEDIFDAALKARGPNEHGPNLRGVASKVTPEWLFAWLKNPKEYWSETRMPNLRLSDQDAADIVAYMFDDPTFLQTPEGWESKEATYKRDVLEEQARWFFNRVLRDELELRFQNEWKDDSVLLETLGERWVLQQGCHSCHEIDGLQDAQPIGAELTTWSSKTVDKLDFGFMPQILAEQHGWSHHEEEEFKQYRENFLAQKLDAPRSYDRKKVKNPTERLKMPWFDFTSEQIDAITTFVAGLVEDEVQHAKMVPDAAQQSMNTGLRVLRQKNCQACHVVEPAQITFKDGDGVEHTVHGEMFPFDEDFDPLPPNLSNFDEYYEKYQADYEAENGERIEEVIVRLLEPVPGLGDASSTVIIEDLDSLKVEAPWGGDLVRLITEHYMFSEEVEDVDGELRGYSEEAYDKLRWTFAPPTLVDEGAKLQPEWFYGFLVDPMPLREQVRVRMPTFNWGEGEAAAVADYFAHRAELDWPSKFARNLLVDLDKSPEQVAEEMADLGLRGSAKVVQGIVDKKPVETATGIDAFRSYADSQGYEMDGPVDTDYEAIEQRSPSTMDPLSASDPDFFARVHNLALSGPNCVQCHFLGDNPPTQSTPIAWAPNLDHTRERLRPDWTREWLMDPGLIYPGTSMPANFPPGEPQWQELYPGSSREQIEAVLVWLYNLDRASVDN